MTNTHKKNFNKGLEGLINIANQMYLKGKENTPEYHHLCMNMAAYIVSNNRPNIKVQTKVKYKFTQTYSNRII